MKNDKNYKITTAGGIPIKDIGSYFTSTEVESALQELGSSMSLVTNPLVFKDSIALASGFPTSAAVKIGWFYIITADVTDNDATKTNTGQSFKNGDEIVWNGTNWTVLGNLTSETDPIVGAINGIVKANGAGVISAATAGTDYVAPNAAITGATKTKVTYDAKGLVTSGADATTNDIADSTNKRYVTDAQLTVIGNTSGTNTGDVSVTDSTEIDFTLTGQNITASLIAGSIDETKLDTSVNASLDKADSAVQAASVTTFTNKTIDANGTGNSISNLEVADLAAGVLDTDLSSVSASDNTIPSAKATKSALDLKAPTTSPTFATSITGSYLTASEVLITDADKKIVSAPVATYPSLTELSYVKGTTSAIQTQLGAKASLTGTETLTNKRINPRLVTAASYTTDTGTSLNCDTTDQFEITAQAGDLLFNNPSGTPVGGQGLIIRIKDNGTARALTYNAIFRAIGVTLPTTTVISKTLYMGFIYNATDTKWDCVAVVQEA